MMISATWWLHKRQMNYLLSNMSLWNISRNITYITLSYGNSIISIARDIFSSSPPYSLEFRNFSTPPFHFELMKIYRCASVSPAHEVFKISISYFWMYACYITCFAFPFCIIWNYGHGWINLWLLVDGRNRRVDVIYGKKVVCK